MCVVSFADSIGIYVFGNLNYKIKLFVHLYQKNQFTEARVEQSLNKRRFLTNNQMGRGTASYFFSRDVRTRQSQGHTRNSYRI